MQRIRAVRVVGVVGFCLAIVACGTERSVEGQGRMEPMSFGISVMTDKPSYIVDEPITITLRVFNDTKENITFSFSSAQRYDFAIEHEKGDELWRWSKGKMFAQVLGQKRVGAGQKELAYSATYDGKLTPGKYKVTGGSTCPG